MGCVIQSLKECRTSALISPPVPARDVLPKSSIKARITLTASLEAVPAAARPKWLLALRSLFFLCFSEWNIFAFGYVIHCLSNLKDERHRFRMEWKHHMFRWCVIKEKEQTDTSEFILFSWFYVTDMRTNLWAPKLCTLCLRWHASGK